MNHGKSTLLIILVALAAGIVSCSSSKPVPIAYQCPLIILPNDPDEPVRNLDYKSQPDEVMKAWIATATGYRNWNRIVRRQIGMSK